MARGRQRAEWERTAAVIQWAGATLDGKPATVGQIAPPGLFDVPEPKPEAVIDPAMKQAIDDARWDMLTSGLMEMKGRMRGK